MPRYLFQGSYTSDGIKGILKEGGSGRKAAIQKLVEGIGGTLESVYFGFGDDDVYAIAEVPDQTSAAAVSLTVGAAGLVKLKTVVLLTPEEIDDATKKSIDYRPPGG